MNVQLGFVKASRNIGCCATARFWVNGLLGWNYLVFFKRVNPLLELMIEHIKCIK